MANSVKCNACQQTFTYADWNNYNGGLTSGIVDIDSDIANEVATKKYYYCPSCHKKLRHSSVTDDNAEGTFDILNENGEIVVLTEEGSGSGEIVENIPDAVQIRYSYDPVVFISESETTAQQGLISWKNANGLTMYGTKAMNSTQKGISEAHRLLKLKEIQAKNMGKALKKLRMINGTSSDKFKLAIFGDSVMWGFWTLTDSKYKLGTEEGDESSDYFNDVFDDDYGQTCDFGKYGIYANTIRIPYRMVQALNSVYDNKIEFISKIWTGTTASASSSSAEGGAATHWKASKADLCIINLGINDAMGGHISVDYRGNVDKFISGYRALVERELENETAVVILGPVRQAMIGRTEDTRGDLDDRTMVDIYEQILKDLAQDYGIPYIDGNIMTKNLSNKHSIDFTHFTKEGNTAIGYRLASILIGRGPANPLYVGDNSYLSVRHQIDNVNLIGGADFSYADDSPNIEMGISTGDLNETDITRTAGGVQVILDNNTKALIWSFYCNEEGMIVVPSFKASDTNSTVKMELDFGAVQGSYANEWEAAESADAVVRTEPVSSIEIASANLTGNKYSKFMVKTNTDPVLRIATEGWHTIKLTMIGTGSVNVYGISFMSASSYSNKLLLESIKSRLS